MIETARTIVLVAAFALAGGTGLFAIAAEYRRNPKGWASPVGAALLLFVVWLLLRGYAIAALLLLLAPILFWTLDQTKRVDPDRPPPEHYEGLGKVRVDKLGCWTTAALCLLIALAMLLEVLAGRGW